MRSCFLVHNNGIYPLENLEIKAMFTRQELIYPRLLKFGNPTLFLLFPDKFVALVIRSILVCL